MQKEKVEISLELVKKKKSATTRIQSATYCDMDSICDLLRQRAHESHALINQPKTQKKITNTSHK